jgi:hypothetical protein
MGTARCPGFAYLARVHYDIGARRWEQNTDCDDGVFARGLDHEIEHANKS